MLNEEEVKPSGIETQDVKEQEVQALLHTGPATVLKELSGTGFTYRHDWGNRRGQWRLNLNWWAVNCKSKVFVSASEFGGGKQCSFIGDVRYTVHNVATFNGGVSVRVNIEWDSPIRVRLDYLVINP